SLRRWPPTARPADLRARRPSSIPRPPAGNPDGEFSKSSIFLRADAGIHHADRALAAAALQGHDQSLHHLIRQAAIGLDADIDAPLLRLQALVQELQNGCFG